MAFRTSEKWKIFFDFIDFLSYFCDWGFITAAENFTNSLEFSSIFRFLLQIGAVVFRLL